MSSINNVEQFRQRLRDGKVCVGTSVQVTDPFVSELAAEAGNDFIETIDAVNDLDAILATPGLDGISLGRNDLSGTLNKLGQHSDPEVLEAIDTVLEKASKTELSVGCSIGADLDLVKQWYAKGVQWFALGEELSYFFDGTKAVAEAVHALDDG